LPQTQAALFHRSAIKPIRDALTLLVSLTTFAVAGQFMVNMLGRIMLFNAHMNVVRVNFVAKLAGQDGRSKFNAFRTASWLDKADLEQMIGAGEASLIEGEL